MDQFHADWEALLSERDLSEMHFARLYAAEFHHGTDGHSRLMLLAKLAEMLDRVERETDVRLQKLYEPKA